MPPNTSIDNSKKVSRKGDGSLRTQQAPMWVRLSTYLSKTLAVPAALATAVLMLHVVANVLSRRLFNVPLAGTLDITSYWWMVLIVFGALAYAQLKDEHIRATIITSQLPLKAQKIADIIALSLMAIFALLMAYFGWWEALASAQIQKVEVSAIVLPIWPFMFLQPLAGIALALQCCVAIHSSLQAITSSSIK